MRTGRHRGDTGFKLIIPPVGEGKSHLEYLMIRRPLPRSMIVVADREREEDDRKCEAKKLNAAATANALSCSRRACDPVERTVRIDTPG